jgi:adenosylcobinamide-phosphate synthase
MAGALGVRLGGRNVYFGRIETRPFLGDGPRPSAADLRRAARISGTVGLAAAAISVATALVRGAVPARGAAEAGGLGSARGAAEAGGAMGSR